VIISASRRTDLPAAHAHWLVNRFREGFALVRNPMNPRQVSRVSLARKDVEGVVFWTKNPQPLLAHLNVFEDYPYYFQYTLTGYDRETEMSLPVHNERIDTYLKLAERIGPERVLWRCDPILISDRYSVSWHERAFRRLAERLRDATERVTISFVDEYPRNKQRLKSLGAKMIPESEMRSLAKVLADIAKENAMTIAACSEPMDFTPQGVAPARCIDADLLSRIGGIPLRYAKDPNQRKACGCAPSVDIGAYNTCPHGCVYCYANYSPSLLKANLTSCNPASPLLCGEITPEDKITDRKMPSMIIPSVQLKI